MATPQTATRAFAQKLSRDKASDVRKQASATLLGSPMQTSTLPSRDAAAQSSSVATAGVSESVSCSSSLSSLVLMEVADPIDFEEYASQRKGSASFETAMMSSVAPISGSSPRRWCDFPADDVDVRTARKEQITIDSPLPTDVNLMSLAAPFQDLIIGYRRNLVLVHRKYFQYSTAELFTKQCVERPIMLQTLPQQTFETDYGTPVNSVTAGSVKTSNRPASLVEEPSNRTSYASRNSSDSTSADSMSTARESVASANLHESASDPIFHSLMDRVSPSRIDSMNDSRRMHNRHGNFMSLMPLQNQEDVVELRTPPSFPIEHTGQRLLAKVLSLSLECEFEPIFCSMTLYDAREKMRISETFHFDANSEAMKRMLRNHIPYEDGTTQAKAAVFSVTYPSPDMFLVIKLEKVLQACDINEAAEPYIKEDKNRDKLRTSATEICDRLGAYRMALAWAAVDLSKIISGASTLEWSEATADASLGQSDTESIVSADRASQLSSSTFRRVGSGSSWKRPGAGNHPPSTMSSSTVVADDAVPPARLDALRPMTLTVSNFFKQDSDHLSDDDLCKHLLELRKPSANLAKRFKCIPGVFKLELSGCPEDLPNRLTPDLLRINPYTPGDYGTDFIKELTEFPHKEVYTPNYSYKNLLFVYPKGANLSSLAGGRPVGIGASSGGRNIAVRVELRNGAHPSPLAVIAGRVSGPELLSHCYGGVSYHNRSPQFYDEIKLRLPLELTDDYHLLFTFYHVSCKSKTAAGHAGVDAGHVETPIGYTWFPLMYDGRLTEMGDISLPISSEKLPNAYYCVRPDTKGVNLKWLDGGRPTFHLSTKVVSTIHTQDPFLNSFFRQYHCLTAAGCGEVSESALENLVTAVRDLTKAKPEPLVNFLYVVFDKLLDLIVCPPYVGDQKTTVSATSFEMLGQLVKIITYLVDYCCDRHGRSSLLTTYIHYYNLSTKFGNGGAMPAAGVSRHKSVDAAEFARRQPPHSLALSASSTPASAEALTVDRMTASSSATAVTAPLSPGSKQLFDIIRGFEQRSSSAKEMGALGAAASKNNNLHEELMARWVHSSGASRETACVHSWFFLELTVKSMAEFLSLSSRLYLPRKLRFSEQFCEDVKTTVVMLTNEVTNRCLKEPRAADQINSSVAFFLRDCLSLMDRSFIISLIRNYCVQMSVKIAGASPAEMRRALMVLKFNLLRVISSHEHFLVLNLPFLTTTPSRSASQPQLTLSSNSAANNNLLGHPPSPSPSVSSKGSQSSSTCTTTGSSGLGSTGVSSIGAVELSADYRSRHFLIGLILADLAATLDTSDTQLQQIATQVVRNLLSAHDADARISDMTFRQRLALLYFPLIGIVLDCWSRLYDPYGNGWGYPGGVDEAPYDGFGSAAGDGPGLNPKVALAIAGIGVTPPSSPPMTAGRKRGQDGSTQPRSHFSRDTTRQLLAAFCWVLKNLDQATLRNWLRELSPLRMTQFLDVLHLCVSVFEFQDCQQSGTTTSQPQQVRFKMIEEAIIGPNTAAKEWKKRRHAQKLDEGLTGGSKTSTSVDPSIRWRKERVLGARTASGDYAFLTSMEGNTSSESNHPLIEGNLATEISLIVLDNLELVLRIIGPPGGENTGADHLTHLLPNLTRVLTHMLTCNQSVTTLESVFASSRALVAKHRELLFDQLTDQCGDLCLQLLRHCASRLTPVRANAAASLYLLMRTSFEHGGSFARLKMQITVALSRLVSGGGGGIGSAVGPEPWLNENHLRRSLKTILTYAETNAEGDARLRQTSFTEQVKDLVFNLHMILSDTVKMKEFRNDFEMLTDLMYRIAKGYQNSPDLRVTWLMNMLEKHVQQSNWAEAAQCCLHSSALAAEYLRMIDNQSHLPRGAQAFMRISENILEESAVSEDVISPEEQGICESRYFTEAGLVYLLEQTASYMERAQMYEAMGWVYDLMLPILENVRDYRRISQLYSKLSEAYAKIDSLSLLEMPLMPDAHYAPPTTADKRVLGTFFRVGFYGVRFGDLNGAEFVYKEPAITKLSEISHRLERFYTDRFGAAAVVTIKDSNAVDRSKLEDTSRLYLQITYVEPYFERWELRRRPTHFERSYNLSRFVYATPFTKVPGKAHGDLRDQYKRRTVLTTQHSFPYVKTRIRVVDRDQTELTPIEVAIEDIQKKTRELAAATTQQPVDAKMLQMVLQGCIGTTVNQGPMEIANVFLCNAELGANGKPMDRLQNKLRLCFKDFSKKCADALQRNHQLIQIDQRAYQKELERNYIEFTKQLAPLVGTTAASLPSSTLGRRGRKHTDDHATSGVASVGVVNEENENVDDAGANIGTAV